MKAGILSASSFISADTNLVLFPQSVEANGLVGKESYGGTDREPRFQEAEISPPLPCPLQATLLATPSAAYPVTPITGERFVDAQPD